MSAPESSPKPAKGGEDKLAKSLKKEYEVALEKLQMDLVEMQDWVKATKSRVLIIFEGRDAAGKGGAIKRLTEFLNPRICRVVALAAPTERERTQWYFQRYIQHLPAGGEIVVFDRSWYNRAGVEKVMGFCTDQEYERFLEQVPELEKMLIDDGILLRKYWFSVSDAEQQRRFVARATDRMRQYKISPMDLASITRWEDYSAAKDAMFARTSTKVSPWYDVDSDDKRRARLNFIAHLLKSIPWTKIEVPKIVVPERPLPTKAVVRPPIQDLNWVPDVADQLVTAVRASKHDEKEEADRDYSGA